MGESGGGATTARSSASALPAPLIWANVRFLVPQAVGLSVNAGLGAPVTVQSTEPQFGGPLRLRKEEMS